MIGKRLRKTDIEKEFDKDETCFMTEVYRDGKPMVWMMNSTSTLAFNTWSYLTRAKPLFDEVRIRVATDDEVKEWYEESPFDAQNTDCGWK